MIEFTADFARFNSDAEKIDFQWKLTYAHMLKNKIVKNIDKNFGGRVVGQQGTAGIRSGRSGTLRNSVVVSIENNEPIITVGGQNVPYASIHEFGGIITPKNRKWLTIPVADDVRGRRAKEFKLHFIQFSNARAGLFAEDKRLKYLLVKRVTIPARPYIQPAIDELEAGAS